MSRAAIRRVQALLDERMTGKTRANVVRDLRAVLALAREAEGLRKGLAWAATALDTARDEGLIGCNSIDDESTDLERAAEDEFQENMAPIRAALAPLPAHGKRRGRR